MAQTRTILVIDDDEDLRGALVEQLDLEDDLHAIEANTAGAGVETAKTSAPDLILLDVDLPDFDGREACRRMREAGVAAPIIMLTGQDSDADTIKGLDAGADDYVPKPFKFQVLLARIRAQLRSHEQSENAVFHIGPYEFRPAQKVLLQARRRCG